MQVGMYVVVSRPSRNQYFTLGMIILSPNSQRLQQTTSIAHEIHAAHLKYRIYDVMKDHELTNGKLLSKFGLHTLDIYLELLQASIVE